MSDDDIQTEIVHLTEMTPEEAERTTNEAVAMQISKEVMEAYGPGVVIVTTPWFSTSAEGIPIPSSIGVTLNPESDITVSGLALLLRHMATSLENDVNSHLEGITDDD